MALHILAYRSPIGTPTCFRNRREEGPPVMVWRRSIGCETDGMTQRALHLTAAITHEGEWYVSRCLQVEVASQGRTIEEALANLREALELYFEDEPVPEVYDVITAPIEVRVA
jgi:predicted RNase H-like HicB family nuclease